MKSKIADEFARQLLEEEDKKRKKGAHKYEPLKELRKNKAASNYIFSHRGQNSKSKRKGSVAKTSNTKRDICACDCHSTANNNGNNKKTNTQTNLQNGKKSAQNTDGDDKKKGEKKNKAKTKADKGKDRDDKEESKEKGTRQEERDEETKDKKVENSKSEDDGVGWTVVGQAKKKNKKPNSATATTLAPIKRCIFFFVVILYASMFSSYLVFFAITGFIHFLIAAIATWLFCAQSP